MQVSVWVRTAVELVYRRGSLVVEWVVWVALGMLSLDLRESWIGGRFGGTGAAGFRDGVED